MEDHQRPKLKINMSAGHKKYNLATNIQGLVAKVKNLVALAPGLGAISHPGQNLNWN